MSGMDPERRPVATVEAVREELNRLGYLDSGLDRFVLAGGESTSPLRASLGVALRVGVLGGALFGLAATLAAVGLDRRLLGEPRDIVVLGAYLAALLGLPTARAAVVGGLAAARAGRRGAGRPAGPPAPPVARAEHRHRRGSRRPRLLRALVAVPPRRRARRRPRGRPRARRGARARPRPVRLAGRRRRARRGRRRRP